MHQLRLISAILLASAAAAADGVPPSGPPTSPSLAPPGAPSTHFDPTAAVVAEGHFVYRQRDLDALVLIAQRHARGKLSKADEERLRPILLQALTAREALIDVLGGLPASLAGKAHDALILDLIDYQAEPASVRPAAAGAPPPLPGSQPPSAGSAAPVQAASDGAILVRLPALTLVRTLEGIGRRQLVLGLALYFRDPALSKSLEAKAPLLQDAILGYMQHLPPAQFAEPDQLQLKAGLLKAVSARVPEFPSDGILIPQLDVTIPDNAAAPPVDNAH